MDDRFERYGPRLFYLEGKTAVRVRDVLQWAELYSASPHHVADDEIHGVRISTIFLGLDHNVLGPTPILFETMIFGGERDGEQWRYSTWDEAEAGHAEACSLVRRSFIRRVS
jgi:hypothetical protein